MAMTKKEMAADPNTQPEILLALAYDYPAEVLENPVLPLVAMENPELGARITLQARSSLLYRKRAALLRRLPRIDGQLFALDIADRYLALYEAKYPRRAAPRRALEELRAYYRRGDADSTEKTAIYRLANAAWRKAKAETDNREALLGITFLEYVLKGMLLPDLCTHASLGRLGTGPDPHDAVDATRQMVVEQEWQVARIEDYLAGRGR